MRLLRYSIVVLISFMVSLPATAVGNPVSDEVKTLILKFANSVSQSSENEDIDTIMSYMSNDVIVIVKSKDNSEQQRYNHNSYKNLLGQIFPLISNYNQKRSQETFTRKDNGDIIFNFILDEQYKVDRKVINEKYKVAWHLRPVSGTYKAYKLLVNPLSNR